MAPKPVGKDLQYFTTLTSTYSLRKFPLIKWTTLRAIGDSNKLEESLVFIEEHGTGDDMQRMRNTSLINDLGEISQFFENMRPQLSETMDRATEYLKTYITSGPHSRKSAVIVFQEMLQNATRSARLKSSAAKLDARRNFDAELERIVNGEDDNDVKIAEIKAAVNMLIQMSASSYAAQED